MTDRDRSEGSALRRDPEVLSDRRLVLELAEETDAEFEGCRGEQYVLDRSTTVYPPVRHGPGIGRGTEPGRRLVDLAISSDVARGVHREDE